jgi:hypothetical protein
VLRHIHLLTMASYSSTPLCLTIDNQAGVLLTSFRFGNNCVALTIPLGIVTVGFVNKLFNGRLDGFS